MTCNKLLLSTNGIFTYLAVVYLDISLVLDSGYCTDDHSSSARSCTKPQGDDLNSLACAWLLVRILCALYPWMDIIIFIIAFLTVLHDYLFYPL